MAENLIQLLQYLLPGFLSAWVFYGFTSFERPSQFERVVQALILTLFVQSIVYLYKTIIFFLSRWISLGVWSDDVELISSVIIAAVLGFVFAFFANSDKFHAFIRWAKISKETSYPTEWFGEFSKQVTYVVLHLDGERRLYGWPKEWPSSPNKGHFSLMQPSWLDKDKEIPLLEVESILVPADQVCFVEFMKKNWEQDNDQEIVESTSSGVQKA